MLPNYLQMQGLKDKNAILVIGNTGAGKSLFLNHVAGRKIVKNRVKIKGIEHNLWDAEDPLCDVGHLNISTTNSVLVCRLVGDCNHVAVDTAGFGDTREEERDIATAISLKSVVDSSLKCRFVAVVNSHGWFESRAEGVRSLVRLLTDFIDIGPFEQCFDVVFTKCQALEVQIPPARDATKEAEAERKKKTLNPRQRKRSWHNWQKPMESVA